MRGEVPLSFANRATLPRSRRKRSRRRRQFYRPKNKHDQPSAIRGPRVVGGKGAVVGLVGGEVQNDVTERRVIKPTGNDDETAVSTHRHMRSKAVFLSRPSRVLSASHMLNPSSIFTCPATLFAPFFPPAAATPPPVIAAQLKGFVVVFLRPHT